MGKIVFFVALIMLFPEGCGKKSEIEQSQPLYRMPRLVNDDVNETDAADMLARINKAKALLAKRELEFSKTFSGAFNPNVLLAVSALSDPFSPIELVYVSGNGQAVTEGFSVTKAGDLGVGSPYSVLRTDSAEELAVLAIKTVLKQSDGYQEVVYTPYHKMLDTKEVRRAGYSYLMQCAMAAAADLRRQRIVSQAFPKFLVADVFRPELPIMLAIIEHVSPFEFVRLARRIEESEFVFADNRLHIYSREKAEIEAIKRLARKVLVVVGANQESAYDFSKSNMGARGLKQMIEGTYWSVREQYPEASLPEAFEQAMISHVTAFKASYLLLDADLLQAKRAGIDTGDQNIGLFLAATYNGGSGRAVAALSSERSWLDGLWPETRIYVREYAALSAAFEESP
ncbi:MAG: hypothetical protein COT91_03460 [Candidatus Doudnabacteria bacterium CG10_big_fil_rev_8_21_14_0_10_41_10]|uniref:Transglycosylase SLT domain-containing protein n=1 Tax=Candidatus Doudnabacteria bacterium CG10_big_fil_rev_8_21_14_0_10_41_10 TaxID=1974551 RepID=A0A2H0VFB1_9BACT|nr:MAG: hypothetical protein COT91_03460 [Candidatus Doudnabacteria bacterium CG10_big_fil_rev_8_21_14_0_10_41_10]